MTKEIAQHPAAGDPGDEQPDLSNIIETPEWLKDNQCQFVKDEIRCILPEGHKTQHDYPNSPYCCYQREYCWGRTSCRQRPACSS